MKKLAIAFALTVIITGCSTIRPSERIVLSVFSDYSKYADEGFLISPSAYTYNFDSVGEINIMVTPAKVKKEVKSLYSSYTIIDYEKISYDEMVELAVKMAKEKGANALVNFSINTEPINLYDRMNGRCLVGEIYYIKGFCIKRK